jgi:hypothetical protein
MLLNGLGPIKHLFTETGSLESPSVSFFDEHLDTCISGIGPMYHCSGEINVILEDVDPNLDMVRTFVPILLRRLQVQT